MIKLYIFPMKKGLGLSNYSPFCVKAELFFRAAGVEYEKVFFKGNPALAPKGKLPFIKDGETVIPDSEFIMDYFKNKKGIDFDSHLSSEQKNDGWAYKKMIEDSLGWTMIYFRWFEDLGWAKTEKAFFAVVPAFLRALIARILRKKTVRRMIGQGIGRHSEEEILTIARSSLRVLSERLADKTYFFGDKISTLDLSAFGFLANIYYSQLDDKLKKECATFSNLEKYVARIQKQYWPS